MTEVLGTYTGSPEEQFAAAVQRSVDGILENFDYWRRQGAHNNESFSIYFVCGNELHDQQRQRLFDALGMQAHPFENGVLLTENGDRFRVTSNHEDDPDPGKRIPYDITWTAEAVGII